MTNFKGRAALTTDAPGAGQTVPPREGLRERKRRETRQRIAESGLRLFLENGYENTTLDAVAAEAGVSRMTIFSYFASKDDIVMSWHDAGWAKFRDDLLRISPDVRPIDAVRDVILTLALRLTTDEMVSVEKLTRSSAALIARKQAYYAQQERELFDTLQEVWRQPQRSMELRIVAMASVGAMRVARQAWIDRSDPDEPISKFIAEAFERLRLDL